MASKKVNIGEFSAEVEKALVQYTEAVRNDTDDAVEEVADYAVKLLRDTSPGLKRRGSYAAGWTHTKPTKGSRGVGLASITVYNKNKPSLAHLLENGTQDRRQKKTGRKTGRVVGDHHIAAAEERVQDELMKRLEALGNG